VVRITHKVHHPTPDFPDLSLQWIHLFWILPHFLSSAPKIHSCSIHTGFSWQSNLTGRHVDAMSHSWTVSLPVFYKNCTSSRPYWSYSLTTRPRLMSQFLLERDNPNVSPLSFNVSTNMAAIRSQCGWPHLLWTIRHSGTCLSKFSVYAWKTAVDTPVC